jgi:hypothetical protein
MIIYIYIGKLIGVKEEYILYDEISISIICIYHKYIYPSVTDTCLYIYIYIDIDMNIYT